MRRALALARKGIGRTAPNPAVGSVIVQNGTIVGEGWHRQAGTPHAEIHALRGAVTRARGADVYVTLEPCCHFGKTPPCADALVAAGVKRVVIGMVDPNPKVSGQGIAQLQFAGIEVVTGILEEECRSINRPFIKHITTGLPYVTLKSAMTLDGKTATTSGDSRWVTGEKARQQVHALRSISDAVMVGVGTVFADDPLLTSRIKGGRDPRRVIVDSTLRMPLQAKVFHAGSSAGTIVATCSADTSRIGAVESLGAEVLRCRNLNGRVDLHDLMTLLGGMGVQSILLEGGAQLAGALLHARLIDRCIFFYAPRLLGGDGTGLFAGAAVERMADAIPMENISVKRCGDDIMIEGEPSYRCLPD